MANDPSTAVCFSDKETVDKSEQLPMKTYFADKLSDAPESFYEKIMVSATDVNKLDRVLDAVFRSAKDGGRISVNCTGNDAEAVARKLRMAGFASVTASYDNQADKISASAEKPDFSRQVSLNLDAAAAAGNNFLVDEDDLLEDEPFQKPTAESLKASCGPADGEKKKRACKNCTCGLADEEEAERVEASKSNKGCGSCALGDAFRCATCPYLGMPPFKPGETVKLQNVDDF
ncbi:unnamed protein product, partial [Mesorhabditis spiculigera]